MTMKAPVTMVGAMAIKWPIWAPSWEDQAAARGNAMDSPSTNRRNPMILKINGQRIRKNPV